MPRKEYDLQGAQKALIQLDDSDFDGIEQAGTGTSLEIDEPFSDGENDPRPPEKEDDERESEDEVTTADEIAAMRTELAAYREWQTQEFARRDQEAEHRRQYQEQQRQRQNQEPPVPTRYLTDLDLGHVYEMSQRIQAIEERAGKAIESAKRSELASFKRAEAAMLEKYPDLEDFIPAGNRELAIKTVLEQEAFGVDWEVELGRVYRDKAFDKHHSKKDELSQKRQEKQTEAAKSASRVVSGGSPYQEPQSKKPMRDTRYHSAKDRAMAAFDAIGGGG